MGALIVNGTLTTEVQNAIESAAQKERERKQGARKVADNSVRDAVNYTLGQEPDGTVWDQLFGAIASIDGIDIAVTYQSSTPTLAVVCTCDQCGERFLSAETFGSDRNHYSSTSERPVAERRARAVEQIAKVVARNYQPNGYGHDHQCRAYETRQIPVALLPRVDALLTGGIE